MLDCRADLYSAEGIEELLKYQPPWITEYNKIKKGQEPEDVGKDC